MAEEVNLVLTVAHSEDWAFIETQLVLEPVSYSGIFSQTSDPHVTSCLSSGGGGGGGLWWNTGSPSSQIICHWFHYVDTLACCLVLQQHPAASLLGQFIKSLIFYNLVTTAFRGEIVFKLSS